MRHVRWRRGLLLAALMLLALPGVQAQIKIGQTAGFTGPVAAGAKEITDGARLYLDHVNAQGGIGGEPIELISLDDWFEPQFAVENARRLIDQGVLALFLTRGTPHTQAIMPLLTEYGVPLVAPSSGGSALRQPVHPWVFNVRASYQLEAERAVTHLHHVGMERVAIVQVDDGHGDDAAIGALKGLAMLGKRPVAHEKFSRLKPDFATLMSRVAAARAQAVLIVGAANAVVEGVARLRAAGSVAQVVTLSNNASQGFASAMGRDGVGMLVWQVFPYERSLATPIVREAHELARNKGLFGVTPAMMEGFAAAKVLVAGLRRAGKDLTRTGLQKALESFRRVDIGGLYLSYSATDHGGLDYAEVAMIDNEGRFRR